ncbi:phosphotransferase family protein [Nocardia sp. NPDC019395]|uniref:phosphotransferase family protein n=1 Tax=Nocardia sp. NPDC019395 TaxID=3154686 RepID=UPI0033F41CD8
MEQAPVFPKRGDVEATAERLRPWLADRLGVADIEIDDLSYPKGAGVSNETILFRARDGRTVDHLVLRIAPGAEHQMFYDPRFRVQYDIVVALRRHGTVRVPDVLWLEDDPAVLGRPFYLMRRMRGNVPVSMPVYNSTGWLVDATPAQRRTLWTDAVHQLAAIHRVPTDVVSFVDRPEDGATGDEQQLTYWRNFAAWALEDEVPETILQLFGWLDDNRPRDPVAGLSWGDARMGNIMFDDNFRVVGVMDWEQVSLAGPVADLAWWLMFDEAHSHGVGVPRLAGLGTRDETIELWEELTGLPSGDLPWHEAFASLKAGLLSLRSRRMRHQLPSTEHERFSFLRRACEMTGVATQKELL